MKNKFEPLLEKIQIVGISFNEIYKYGQQKVKIILLDTSTYHTNLENRII